VTSRDFLSTPLQYVRGVGPRRAADLERVGLITIEDLLLRFPLRYENRADLQPIGKLRPGQVATVVGEVVSSGVRPTRRPGFRLFELVVRDSTGTIRAVFPNQAFLRDVFHPSQHVVLYGPVEFRSGLQLANPEFEIIRGEGDEEEGTIHTGRLVPIYEKAGTVTSRMQRTLVHHVLQEMPSEVSDPLPPDVWRSRSLPDRRTAIARTHFPAAGTGLDALNAFATPAQQRLILEEFFLFQAGLLLRKCSASASAARTASRYPSSSTTAFVNQRGASCPFG
jgi:ATP-dependent DNA helicase RecG